jgi:phosphoglycolate phosphatase/AHBA synthesis associated protein
MVLRGCELLGVVPASALVVGDSSFDREAAGAAGVSFAGLGIKGDFDLDRLTDLLEIFDGERVSRAARFS